MNRRQFTDIRKATATFFAAIVFYNLSLLSLLGVRHVRGSTTSLRDHRCCFTDYRTFIEPIGNQQFVSCTIKERLRI